MRIRQAFATVLLGLTPALTGCLTHTRSVPKTHVAPVVLDAPLDQLLKQLDERFDAVQTINATATIVASEGGGLQGKVKELPSLGSYILFRKPEDLQLLLKVPVVGSSALNMVRSGKTWKLWIPLYHIARTGTSEVPSPSQHGLEALRPANISDSLLVRGLAPGEIVSLTSDTRIVTNEKNKKDLTEEPDYELAILAAPQGQTAHTSRVIHISRVDLLPFQQDFYDDKGNIVTRATYNNYQKSGDTIFPMKIKIERPMDQYSLTITVTKLILNEKLEDDQFELKFPDGVAVKDMD
jgi:outer membrane lipoprotein-sorting protein